MNLKASIQEVKGVGPKKAKLFQKVNIKTVEDALNHYPRRYIDRGAILNRLELSEEPVTIHGTVIDHDYGGYSRKKMLKIVVESCGKPIHMTFFNAAYIRNMIEEGKAYYFYGKLELKGTGYSMTHPEFCYEKSKEAPIFLGIMPVYGLTDGLHNREVQKLTQAILKKELDLKDPLPKFVRDKYQFLDIYETLKVVHNPEDLESLKIAQRRLVFQEFFELQLGLILLKNAVHDHEGIKMADDKGVYTFIEKLPFPLTGAQNKVLKSILNDMKTGLSMNRLLQGDVGSGKTIIALLAIYHAVLNGYQGVLMAPTEILAEQHFQSFNEMLGDTMEIVMLTGSTKKKEEVIEKLKSGQADIVIGTHALLEDHVAFKALGIVITDEQHRFGVRQRSFLNEKGEDPHMLVMSATPIPRTLSLIMHGDMDISIIDEMPAGRKEIKTHYIKPQKVEDMYTFIDGQIEEGRQIYFVCPLIEESEVMDLKSAEELFEQLDRRFINRRVALLHGKMKNREKDDIMVSFSKGDLDIIVSTTVIEVGINVPNASIMVIENAERFGLAQLHQLRGRVGRGEHQSYCFLLSDKITKKGKERIEALISTNDGFKIADKDLEIRGPGELLGMRQHGIPEFKLADLTRDRGILEDVQGEVKTLIEHYKNGQVDAKVYIDSARDKLFEHFSL